MEDTVRSDSGETGLKRPTTVLVSLSLLSVGLLTIAPSAAATDECNGISLGGHDSDDPFHLCIYGDIVPASKEVPEIRVDCPTCVPGAPSADPMPPDDPPTGDLDLPGIDPPWYPGTPDNDNCLFDTDVCHPTPSEIISWASAYAEGWIGWDPDPRCITDCYTPPSPSEIHDYRSAATAWALENVDSVETWAENQADRYTIGNQTLDVVGPDTGNTHVDPHGNAAEPFLDEACQVIYGDGAEWEDCAVQGPGETNPCERFRDCPITMSMAYPTDDPGTPGILIETDGGEVFVPVTELT